MGDSLSSTSPSMASSDEMSADVGRRADVARHLVSFGKGVAGIAGATLLWELGRTFGVLPSRLAPGITDIGRAMVDGFSASGNLTDALVITVDAWARGLAAAILVAVPLGAAIGVSRWADAATHVLIEFIRPIPAVALIPVAIVLFGLQTSMQVSLIAFACIWPILFSTRYGVRNVDPLFHDTAKVMGVSDLGRAWKVTAPAALPAVFTGIRTAASIGIVVAIAAQIVAGAPGLGFQLSRMQQGGNVPGAFAALVVTGILGYMVNLVMGWAEKRLAGWQHEMTVRTR